MRYRSLLDNISVITNIHDSGDEFTLLYVSLQVQKLLGYQPQEFLSDPKLGECPLHPNECARVLAAVQQAIQLVLLFTQDYRMNASNGQVIWLNDRAELMYGPIPKKLEWLRVWSDITSRKQAEEKIICINVGVEPRVIERTAQPASAAFYFAME